MSTEANASSLLEAGYSRLGSSTVALGESWNAPGDTDAPTERGYQSAVWTGTEMIIWGGSDGSGSYLNTGGRYNPVTRVWTPTSTVNAPAARFKQRAVWTGTEMIVWGGNAGGGKF